MDILCVPRGVPTPGDLDKGGACRCVEPPLAAATAATAADNDAGVVVCVVLIVFEVDELALVVMGRGFDEGLDEVTFVGVVDT